MGLGYNFFRGNIRGPSQRLWFTSLATQFARGPIKQKIVSRSLVASSKLIVDNSMESEKCSEIRSTFFLERRYTENGGHALVFFQKFTRFGRSIQTCHKGSLKWLLRNSSTDSIGFDLLRHSTLRINGFERLFTILLRFTQVVNVHKCYHCSQTLNTLLSEKVESRNRLETKELNHQRLHSKDTSLALSN